MVRRLRRHPGGFGLTLCFSESIRVSPSQTQSKLVFQHWVWMFSPPPPWDCNFKDSDLRNGLTVKNRGQIILLTPARSFLFWNGSMSSLFFIQIILFTFTKWPLLWWKEINPSLPPLNLIPLRAFSHQLCSLRASCPQLNAPVWDGCHPFEAFTPLSNTFLPDLALGRQFWN